MIAPRKLFAVFLMNLCVLKSLAAPGEPRPDEFAPKPERADKPRMLVLTDISNEPDDEESLVRLLVYANEYEIEGLVATTSTYLKDRTREDLLHRGIEAYGKVRGNLERHADGYPTADELTAVTCSGQAGFGMAAVAKGGRTPGSQRILDAGDRPDSRPLWICVWGGSNTLAQALLDLRESRTPDEVDRWVAKLRVYAISDQDDAGAWIRKEFPKLFYIVSPSNPNGPQEYYRSTWIGIAGDRRWNIGQMHYIEMVENPWLEEHVIRNHGALGALYPPLKYIMEGDTPSFLGLIDNGLRWEVSPSYGGWGGRYALYQPAGELRAIWTDNAVNRDTVTAVNGRTETSNHATLWRWREHFQNDFAARMDWCVAESYEEANHNPRLVVNGEAGTGVLQLTAKAGETLKLSAAGSDGGDAGQSLRHLWWVYQEAGSLGGARIAGGEGSEAEVILPRTKKAGNVHVILQAEDDGTPKLVSYRRMVIRVSP